MNQIQHIVASLGPAVVLVIVIGGMLFYNAVKQTILHNRKINQRYSKDHRTW